MVPEERQDLGRILTEFEQVLARQGQRLTRQRRIVVDAILRAGPHVDAEAIVNTARSIDERIGVATVYRTLQLLTESGILSERRFAKDRRSFEVEESSGHHDHLICAECGTVFEFCDAEIEELQRRAAERLGFQLAAHRMELVGHCSAGENCPHRIAKNK